MGYLFYPLTIVIGVPHTDAYSIAKIIGEGTVLTEVAAYQDLARVMKEGLIKGAPQY